MGLTVMIPIKEVAMLLQDTLMRMFLIPIIHRCAKSVSQPTARDLRAVHLRSLFSFSANSGKVHVASLPALY
jgi:hypothetical protein